MKTAKSAFHAPAVTGLILMIVPLLFWTAVASAQLFGFSFLKETVAAPIELAPGALPELMRMILPLSGLAWNSVYLSRISVRRNDNELVTSLGIRLQRVNLAVVVSGMVSTGMWALSLVTEKLVVIDRHTGKVLLGLKSSGMMTRAIRDRR